MLNVWISQTLLWSLTLWLNVWWGPPARLRAAVDRPDFQRLLRLRLLRPKYKVPDAILLLLLNCLHIHYTDWIGISVRIRSWRRLLDFGFWVPEAVEVDEQVADLGLHECWIYSTTIIKLIFQLLNLIFDQRLLLDVMVLQFIKLLLLVN